MIVWAFKLTPERLKPTEFADDLPSKPSRSRVWIYVTIVAAALSVGLFFVGRYTAPQQAGAFRSPTKSIAVLPFENLIGQSGYGTILVKTLPDPRAFNRQAYSVVITLEPGLGYALGIPSSATMWIKP